MSMTNDDMAKRLVGVLQTLRLNPVNSEYEIHTAIMNVLEKNDIQYAHEASLGPRCRIDFLVSQVGIEVKKGKVNSRMISDQINRYCKADVIHSLILVVERSVFKAPRRSSNGKPISYISLNKLWGVAV